jgi:RNA-directed DNA polymerase
LWAQQWRKRHARGDMVVVRYADDTVLGFEHRYEAERFLADLQARMHGFGLTLHSEKAKQVRKIILT